MLRHEVAVAPTRPQNMETLPAENQRPGSIAAEIETLRRGNVEVKRLAQHAAKVRRANEELDWTRTLVPLDQLRNVGRKTPGAAICTAYWAAASGEDAVLVVVCFCPRPIRPR